MIADAGVRGLVIQNRAEGTSVDGDRYVAESGMPMARAATETQQAGLTGLEFGLAIPGTVGGAVWANAGAHDADVARARVGRRFSSADGAEARLPAADLGLGYRESRFKAAASGRAGEVVISAAFRLTPASADEIRARLDDIRRWRQAHQPLGDPERRLVLPESAGRPSAGALIDQAGLKGTRIGGASVSPKHANFLVNDGRGTADDVRRLGDLVRDEVERQFGVRLVHEVVFVGDWAAGSDAP